MLLEKILYGIIASFLVPLFLNTISSSLMDEIGTDIKSIFIFIGFCLIASLSSKLFIKTLTDKAISSIQQQQNDTNKRVDNINSAVETVVAKDMANSPIEIDSDKLKIEKNEGYKTLDFVKNKLLLQLGSDENTFFNKRSLAKKTDISISSIIKALKIMTEEKLVNVTYVNNNSNYGLSLNGRKKYIELVNSMDWKVKLVINTNRRNPVDLIIFNIIVGNEYGEYSLNVYSESEELSFSEGDTIVVKSVDGKKVHIKYIKVKASENQ